MVRLAVRFLDDVIEVNPYPLEQVDEMVKANRRVGLGVMGWADLLFTLGIPYDSEEALELAERLMAFIKEKGHDQSARLAEERGPFPHWGRSIYRARPPAAQRHRDHHRAHRDHLDDRGLLVRHRAGVRAGLRASGEGAGRRAGAALLQRDLRAARPGGRASTPDALMTEVARRGSLAGVEGVPAAARAVFKTAHEIDAIWHVRHQAAFQKHTDNGVSKTINLPESATEEDVAAAYRQAWDLGCLGITVFRDGSKGSQVLNMGVRGEGAAADAGRSAASSRARTASPGPPTGWRRRSGPPSSPSTTTAGGEPFEVFVQVGKAGSDTMAVAEALGRLVSLVLRLPSPLSPRQRLEAAISQLSLHRRRPAHRLRRGQGPLAARRARAHAGRAHRHAARDAGARAAPAPGGALRRVGDLCRECGQATLVYEEGCKKCLSCGFNEC